MPGLDLPVIKVWLKIVIPLFIIVDPIGSLPLFASLTADTPEEHKRHMAAKAAVAAAAVLSLFALGGDEILAFFDISLASFRVAGGLILLSIALQMLQAQPRATKSSPEEEIEGRQKEDIAIVPLAVPILAGPGAITTVMVLANGQPLFVKLQVVLASLLVCATSYFILASAARLSRLLGHTGANLFGRLMGLILAVISVEYMARGLGALFPGWLKP